MGKKSAPAQPVYQAPIQKARDAVVNKVVKPAANRLKSIAPDSAVAVAEAVESKASLMKKKHKKIRKSVLLSGGKGVESAAPTSKQTLLGG